MHDHHYEGICRGGPLDSQIIARDEGQLSLLKRPEVSISVENRNIPLPSPKLLGRYRWSSDGCWLWEPEK